MNLPDTWNALNWLPPLAVLAIIALFVILWTNWSRRVSPGIRVVLTLLKTGALALLCLCLLEPMHSFSRPEPGANTIVVMADSSQSLNVKDRDADVTRAAQLTKTLASDSEWISTLDDQFELRRYQFDTRVDAVTDYDEFNPDGIGSAITGSLRTVSDRLKGKPSAGIILLTDGNSSESLAVRAAMDYSDLPPIFPVVIGSEKPARDVSITSVETSQTNFESAPVTIKTEIVAHGHSGDTVKVELLGKNDESIEIQEVRRIEDGRPFAVRFQLKPTDRGVNLFRVRAYTGDAPTASSANVEVNQSVSTAKQRQATNPEPTDKKPDADASELANRGEATLANNERSVVVDRGRGPFRVLYVSGRPNWEYKFLRRAISDDDELNMVGLIRVAKKEPKFSFRGRTGESTNPLYRGFGNQSDATAEQYDEPVLIRLDTADETELRDGFPKDAKTLFEYDAIVLDDLESKFFTQDQQTLISQFVNIRGGGLLMLGGMDSFASGGFDRTRIGEMLPVYLDQRQPVSEDIEYKLDLTREGWIQPWMRMASTRDEDEKRIEDMPQFRTLNITRSIKPGASVLANVKSTDGNIFPALAVQRFGKGRSAAMLVGDLWRWKLKSDKDNEDLYKSWRQTLRWLVSDVPRRVEVKVGADLVDGEIASNSDLAISPIGKSNISVLAYGEEYKPQLNSSVELKVTTPAGKEIQLTAEQDTKKAGNYTTGFISREPGAYRVSATVRTPEGDIVEQRESGWVSDVAADEFRTLVPNRKWLEEIASKSGGEIIELAELDEFAQTFENRKVPQIETRVEPWWHRWWVFATAMCLLVFEWGTRRMTGLA